MKFVVDEMPNSPEDCPFCNGTTKPTCNLVNHNRCEYFNPSWDYEPVCSFLISVQDLENNA